MSPERYESGTNLSVGSPVVHMVMRGWIGMRYDHSLYYVKRGYNTITFSRSSHHKDRQR